MDDYVDEKSHSNYQDVKHDGAKCEICLPSKSLLVYSAKKQILPTDIKKTGGGKNIFPDAEM